MSLNISPNGHYYTSHKKTDTEGADYVSVKPTSSLPIDVEHDDWWWESGPDGRPTGNYKVCSKTSPDAPSDPSWSLQTGHPSLWSYKVGDRTCYYWPIKYLHNNQ